MKIWRNSLKLYTIVPHVIQLIAYETEKPSNEIQVPAGNNVSSSGNSNILEQSDNNGIVEIYDDSDFGIHNLPREGNQNMNNVNVNQNIMNQVVTVRQKSQLNYQNLMII